MAFAAFAIGRGRKAKSAFGGAWNPASSHLQWGLRLACCGALLSLAVTAILVLYLIDAA
jgi:hypothetical protein